MARRKKGAFARLAAHLKDAMRDFRMSSAEPNTAEGRRRIRDLEYWMAELTDLEQRLSEDLGRAETEDVKRQLDKILARRKSRREEFEYALRQLEAV